MATKKRKPQDITEQDRRAYNKKFEKLTARIRRVEARVKALEKRK